ncbi:hypothetical protein SMB34_12340 [Thalassospira permensis NBRC 106175]|jgi:hypothetical protein|uniref:Uncharacterized protein n=1 Tax=Thalassospira permensis NBRC 106175 TaxID=1353532 RepID=A0ABR4TSH3_9PROT|nr:hypothetical protein SMB34_12340 [Thalassospira permensis NBRC 106175]
MALKADNNFITDPRMDYANARAQTINDPLMVRIKLSRMQHRTMRDAGL